MTSERKMTLEDYTRLLEEYPKLLSSAAKAVYAEAETIAHNENLVPSLIVHPKEFDEAMEEMNFFATRVTDRDRALLAKLARTSLAAAASIDPLTRTSTWGIACICETSIGITERGAS